MWKFVSVAVRLRDAKSNGFCKCISCDYTGYYIRDKLQAGHFFQSRNFKGVRWNFDNIHAQCQKCNGAYHGNIYNYYLSLKKKIGQKRIDDLHADAVADFKETIEFLDFIKKIACEIILKQAKKKNIWDWESLFTKQEVEEIKSIKHE